MTKEQKAKALGNQPAFPEHYSKNTSLEEIDCVPGLTKREYFTGIAMQAIITGVIYQHSTNRVIKMDLLVQDSLRFADNLLIELVKEENEEMP